MDTKQVDIAELAERAKQREIDALKSFISEVKDDFTLPVAKIPENVFVDYFLDHFKALNNNVEVDPTLTAKWVSIVGSPYSPADIVDSKGDKLYSVPPILARPNVNKRLQQVSFNEVSGRYNAEKNRLESAAMGTLVMGIAGELADEGNTPLGSFKVKLMDNINKLNKNLIEENARITKIEEKIK